MMVIIMEYSAGEKFYSSIGFAIIGGGVSFILLGILNWFAFLGILSFLLPLIIPFLFVPRTLDKYSEGVFFGILVNTVTVFLIIFTFNLFSISDTFLVAGFYFLLGITMGPMGGTLSIYYTKKKLKKLNEETKD